MIGFGRKRSWPNLRNYPGIRLEGLRKTTEHLSQDSRSPRRDLKPGHPEYEARVLTSGPRRSVLEIQTQNNTFNSGKILNSSPRR
jgi:hypothetical protein